MQWTWSKTYAASAPHWYIVADRTPGLTLDDFIHAGHLIRTFGEPGRFWSMTNLYLFSADRRMKFWAMWSHPPRGDDATLVNCATTERTYGPQNDFDQDRLGELRLPPR